MTACGLWLARRRLIAVVVDDGGRASPAISACLDDDARWGLLEHVEATHGLDVDLVLAEELSKYDNIGRLALERGLPVWMAPQRLIDAIATAAGLARGPPARTAAMIARLMRVPAWRGHLRRLELNADRRQLSLL